MITNIEEFKAIIEGNYGITDIPSYVEYKKKAGERGITKAEVELLSPDNINSCSFWEYIEKNPELAKDAVSFGITKDDTIELANKQNFRVACSLGALQFVTMYNNEPGMPILDIGAGYGMLKEYVQNHTKLSYYGVDVYPKIEGIHQVASDGSTLPPYFMTGKFGLVIACNVFQHLSLRQRRHYYEQVAKILYPGFGVFTVTLTAIHSTATRKSFECVEDGKGYICHYGQYTPVQPIEEIQNDLLKHFNIISVAQRPWDDSWTFHCSLKEISVPTLDNPI